MPNIYDNIEAKILDGLTAAFTADQTQRADICVGYINLRGWRCIADAIDRLPGDDGKPPCRLIVGMPTDTMASLHRYYTQQQEDASNEVVVARRNKYKRQLAKQLSIGTKSNEDQKGLLAFAAQLKSGKVQVKFFARHRLHAKLYLAHRTDKMAQVIGFVGSSNLTFAGIRKQGELNVDVVEQDAAQKLAKWFDDRWGDRFCFDITKELIDIIEDSWVTIREPYHIYIKTAYELSKDARVGVQNFPMPDKFKKILLKHQSQAVSTAAEQLNAQGGIIIGDVVGLGKTLVASAVAKILDDDLKYSTLVICPSRLQKMWQDHLDIYQITGKVMSINVVNKLPETMRYQLVIIDESHNLRNRESKRYKHVRNYLQQHESRVMLLTATPYNKSFDDLASQLRLFVSPETDLGIRPDVYLKETGGESAFRAANPDTPPSSLAAFEKSEDVDDWRDLLGMFMIRRTRKHIIENYAQEEDGRHFITHNGTRFYFPKRISKRALFGWKKEDASDQYALLYSEEVVDIISNLILPRYGTEKYLRQQYAQAPYDNNVTGEQRDAIKDLTRAGSRLIGFARSNLYKRLESCGPAFITSVRRHIVRNAVYLAAIEQNGALPTGDVYSAIDNEQIEEGQDDLLGDFSPQTVTLEAVKHEGRGIYEVCKSDPAIRGNFKWLPVDFFDAKKLHEHLMRDCNALMKVLQKVPQWYPNLDRKLAALVKLCTQTHADEKILIFTQYKDTAKYLREQFEAHDIQSVKQVFGGIDNIANYVRRFSPTTNSGLPTGESELRILITTDTLSEGQNLQDAHIIVNFDLPWTVIRLVQRAGRVDRIGQQSPEVLCYSFLPEDGIEDIIKLRGKLQERIEQNAQVVGSEEKFFEGNVTNLEDLYAGKQTLYEEDEETDLVSRAYAIWKKAIKDDKPLQTLIENLPDSVYSGKRANENGAIVYIKTTHNHSALMQVDDAGEITSQSQFKILDKLACAPGEPTVSPAPTHLAAISAAERYVRIGRVHLGGALGGANNARRRAYDELEAFIKADAPGFSAEELNDLRRAVDLIYAHPLFEDTKSKIRRQLNAGARGYALAEMVMQFYESEKLCAVPKSDEPIEPRIICSTGLIKP